jgi:hypothetical protein
MSRKSIILIAMTVGSYIGGYIPALWDASMFSFSGVIFTAIGGFTGIYVGYKLSS